MNILLISYLFPPEANPQGFLSARLAKYLKKAGHQVTVLAGIAVGSINSSHGKDRFLMADLEGIEVRYICDRKVEGILLSLKKRLVYHEHYNYWVGRSIEVALPLLKRNSIDVIYSISAPLASNVAGMRLKHRTGIPWVSHFSDPISLSLGKRFKSPLRTYLTYAAERRLLRVADGVTFVNEETLLKTTDFHPAYRGKCIVLPHSFDPDCFPETPPSKYDGDKVRFSYVGSLYSRRNPFNVIDAMNKAAAMAGGDGRGQELHLYGVIDPTIQAALYGEIPPWVRVHGPVSYIESIRAMIETDYLLLIDMPDEDNLYTPSKLMDYLAARRPIIGITSPSSSSARLLGKIGYPVVSPADAEGLCRLFHGIMKGASLEVTMGHHDVLADFRADRIADRLVRFFEERIEKAIAR